MQKDSCLEAERLADVGCYLVDRLGRLTGRAGLVSKSEEGPLATTCTYRL